MIPAIYSWILIAAKRIRRIGEIIKKKKENSRARTPFTKSLTQTLSTDPWKCENTFWRMTKHKRLQGKRVPLVIFCTFNIWECLLCINIYYGRFEFDPLFLTRFHGLYLCKVSINVKVHHICLWNIYLLPILTFHNP